MSKSYHILYNKSCVLHVVVVPNECSLFFFYPYVMWYTISILKLLKSNGPNSISKDALIDEDCPWPYMPITHSNSFQCGIICDNL